MYINLIAHLLKTHFTPITSYITPYSLYPNFPIPIPSPQPTIPINTSIKLQHPTTHPLTPTFHLDETITHIPQHPSLFPPIRKQIATTMAVSSYTPIALLAHTPSYPLKQHIHHLIHTLLNLLTLILKDFTTIASCIASTSPPFTSPHHHHSTPRDAPHINEVHMSRFGEGWSERESNKR